MTTLDDKPRTNNQNEQPGPTNDQQQTRHSLLTDASAAHAPRARNANAKSHLPGKSLPGGSATLNICASATKMKYDVRIDKAEKSGLLSVFFKAGPRVAGVSGTIAPHGEMQSSTPNFEARSQPHLVDYPDFPATR